MLKRNLRFNAFNPRSLDKASWRHHICIERFALKHAGSIADISRRCFEDKKEHISRQLIFSLWLSKRFQGYVVLYENHPIGYVIFDVVHKARQADLISMALLDTYRGFGIASALLEKAIQDLRYICQEFFLEVRDSNTSATGLYEKFGFHLINKRPNYYGPNQHANVYKLSIENIQKKIQEYLRTPGSF